MTSSIALEVVRTGDPKEGRTRPAFLPKFKTELWWPGEGRDGYFETVSMHYYMGVISWAELPVHMYSKGRPLSAFLWYDIRYDPGVSLWICVRKCMFSRVAREQCESSTYVCSPKAKHTRFDRNHASLFKHIRHSHGCRVLLEYTVSPLVIYNGTFFLSPQSQVWDLDEMLIGMPRLRNTKRRRKKIDPRFNLVRRLYVSSLRHTLALWHRAPSVAVSDKLVASHYLR